MRIRDLLAADLRCYTTLSKLTALDGLLRCIVSPGYLACVLIRIQQAVAQRSAILGAILRSLNYYITGVESHVLKPIGPGLYIPHPTGIVLGSGITVGSNVTIYHHVSVGTRSVRGPDSLRWPTLEDGCTLGLGASVLGEITVGAGALVGAHSVLTVDLAPGAFHSDFPSRRPG